MPCCWQPWSQHLRGERDDPHEPLVAELTADGTEDARPARVAAVTDDHRGVLVEADVGTVRTTALLHRADDDCLDHVTPLDPGTGQGVLHGGDDDVADARVATPRAAEHPDAEDLLRTRVVGDTQSRLLLDHVQLPNTCGDSRAGTVNRLSGTRVRTHRRRAPPGRPKHGDRGAGGTPPQGGGG